MIKDRKLCVSVLFVTVFPGALGRVWQTLASLGTCLMEMGWPPAPSHLADPGTTSPGPPALAPRPVPALDLRLLPRAREVISMVTVWGALGHLEPEELRREGCRCPVSPSQGPREISAAGWGRSPEQMRSGWALSFCDFFSYLLPAFCQVLPSPTLCL